ncbi:MAG: hypothetical protein L7F78_04610 [Syntrophales bacterium LBB04]|nr:hypothetical protein [Syntrophales bacterium LBB04]
MDDIIIIGSDVSSWVAALLAVRSGKKTVVLSDGDAPDFFCESGYAFPADPFPFTAMGVSQACRTLLEEVDRELIDGVNLRLLDPCLQIIHKELRIELFSDRERLLTEMAREFPRQEVVIKGFYNWLTENKGFVLSGDGGKPACDSPIKDLSRFIKASPAMVRGIAAWFKVALACRRTPVLQMLFESQLKAFSYQYGTGGAFLSLLPSLARSLEGVYVQEGSIDSFRDKLRNKYLAAGGTLIADCSVMKIATDKEIAVNILTEGRRVKITGRHLIVSTKWEKMKRFMLNNKSFRRLNRRFDNIKAVHHPFTLHLGVHGKGLPEKMGAWVVLLGEKDNPLCSDGSVFLSCSLLGDGARAPEGQRALCATVFLKESPLRLTNEELREAVDFIWKSLEGFLPFIRENLHFLDVEKSITLSRKHQETINGRVELKKGFFPRPNPSVKTPIKNVFVTGGMLLSHLGLEGEIVSGMRAASLAINEGRR